MTSLWPRLCSRLAPERALDPLCDLLCFGGFTFAVKKEQRPAPTLVGIILKYRSGNLSQPHPRHGCIHTADADVFRLPGRVVPLGIWQQMKPQGGLELNQTRLKMLWSSLETSTSMCELSSLCFPFSPPCSQAAFVLGGLLLNLCAITQPTVCNAWFMRPTPPDFPSHPCLCWSTADLSSQPWASLRSAGCRVTDIAVFAATPSGWKTNPVKQTSTNDQIQATWKQLYLLWTMWNEEYEWWKTGR